MWVCIFGRYSKILLIVISMHLQVKKKTLLSVVETGNTT